MSGNLAKDAFGSFNVIRCGRDFKALACALTLLRLELEEDRETIVLPFGVLYVV